MTRLLPHREIAHHHHSWTRWIPSFLHRRSPESRYGKPFARIFGLQTRATLLIGLATLATTHITQSLYFNQMLGMSAQRQKDNALYAAKCIAEGIELAVEADQRRSLDEVASRFAHDADVPFIAIFDPSGRLVANDGHEVGDNALRWRNAEGPATSLIGTPHYVRCNQERSNHLLVDYPIRQSRPSVASTGQGELFGYLRIGTDTSDEHQRLRSALSITSGVGLASFLLTIILAFLVARQLVLPINELTHTARRLAAGDLSARTGVVRADEIGDLARSFNDMASKLQRSHRAITSLNADLENRVQQRTRHLSALANHDALTSLYNRRYFDQHITARFEESRRYGVEFSCLMMDVDGFKRINDSLGHGAGDEVLRTLGKAILESIRSSDLPARYGGDEFVILLPHTDAFSAQALGDRIRERFAHHQAALGTQPYATVSIGAATVSESRIQSAPELLAAADKALYEAKRKGKDRVMLAHALN